MPPAAELRGDKARRLPHRMPPPGLPPGAFNPYKYDEVIVYGRFSTKKQAKGNSEERQREAKVIEETCQRHGWTIIDQYFDRGMSGRNGANYKKGALGRLLDRITDRNNPNHIPPGKVIGIEALDRLGREELLNAHGLFTDLMRAGMAIWEFASGEGYDAEYINKNPWVLGKVQGAQIAARSVSDNMSFRTTQNRVALRDKVTNDCPRWISVEKDNKGQPYYALNEYAAVVQRIFEYMCIMGSQHVVRMLYREKLPCFTRSGKWHETYIRLLIASKTPLGYVQYTTKESGKREIVELKKKYPAAVSQKLWDRANKAVEHRSRLMGNATSGPKTKFANLLGDLARCAICDSRMVLRSKQYLVCHGFYSARCQNSTYHPYPPIEDSILKSYGIIAHGLDKQTSERTETIEDRLRRLQEKFTAVNFEIDEVLGLAGPKPKHGTRSRERLDEKEAERRAVMEQITRVEQELRIAQTALPIEEERKRVEALIAEMRQMPADKQFRLRARISAGLRNVIRSIKFHQKRSEYVLIGVGGQFYTPRTRVDMMLQMLDKMPDVATDDIVDRTIGSHPWPQTSRQPEDRVTTTNAPSTRSSTKRAAQTSKELPKRSPMIRGSKHP